MNKIVIGIAAHVDAGKTTCIESMLYEAGAIRKQGRVDHGDSFLDYDEEERSHGITIYAKEAHLFWKNTEIFVIDTPGHVDFSSEMERTLGVLDLAVILINGQDGVQSHTETIWKCLEHYHVPCLFFVNKMDISHFTKSQLMHDLEKHCSSNVVDWNSEDKMEKLAMVNDAMLDEYSENGTISYETVHSAILTRRCFPVLFGSVLKNQGTDELLDLIDHISQEKIYPEEFGAIVYKVSEDDKGSRLTHVKITGGVLKAKQKISEDEKVDQIRLYSGKEYELLDSASAGMICTLKGLDHVETGQGLGFEKNREKPILNAFLNYHLLYPNDCDRLALTAQLNKLAEEDPQLQLSTDDRTGDITISIMGDMQREVLKKKIYDATGIEVSFGTGSIVYKETIQSEVEGAGHFEPLRHYAEVHVKLMPQERNSGIEVSSECSTDELAATWQKSILESLRRKRHKGVLTGSLLTDVKIVLTAGKGNLKHTTGGDFREASSRAVRQALMKADNILLEPFYEFTLEVPSASLSKALYDLEQKKCAIEVHQKEHSDDMFIEGKGPVRLLMNYQNEVTAFTHGKGRFQAVPCGYEPCQESQEIIAEIGYDPESDLRNPAGSVFCTHGAGYYVPWDESDALMHIQKKQPKEAGSSHSKITVSKEDLAHLVEAAGSRNRNEKKQMAKAKAKEEQNAKQLKKVKAAPLKPQCMIIDGYNLLYSWESLKSLSKEDFSTAREKLIDMMKSYHAYVKCRMILVFDAYKVKENYGSIQNEGSFSLVYTKQSETADQWIEKAAYELSGQYQLTVVTSDALIQNAVFSQGANRISAREMENQYFAMIQTFENIIK